jgi:glycerol kinase
MQELAEQLRIPVERPVVLETTAWGAARLAGLHAGIYPALGEQGARRIERTFSAREKPAVSDAQHEGWLKAIGRVRSG